MAEAVETKSPFKAKVVWTNATAFAILHLGFLYSVYLFLTFQFKWFTFISSLFFGLWSGQSITMGCHRLWAHKTFKARLPLQIFLAIAQCMAGQNSILIWSRDHRLHHKYTDTDADPHNSRRGFFFSHMGWLMMKKHPETISKGKTIDISDLKANPLVMFQYRYFVPLYIFFCTIPVAVAYFSGDTLESSIFIGYFFRYTVQLHSTWCVNSVAHFFGTKPYTKNIRAVESLFVSTVAFGEGWHNYHHTFPWDYKAGEFGNYFNVTCQLIDFCHKIGLAYDMKTVTAEMVIHRAKKYGDGTHWINKMEEIPYSEMVIDDKKNKYNKTIKPIGA